MRRLDELLSHAAERGSWMGPDRLIERLECGLMGEREVLVAAPPRRRAMVATREKPTPTTEIPKRSRNRWAIALAGFAVAVAAVVGAVLVFGADDDVAAPETPAQVMALMTTAIEQADPTQFTNLSSPASLGDDGGRDFLEWNLALGLNPVFTDCETSAYTTVVCDVTMGEDYFYSQVLEENLLTTVRVQVAPDGTFDVLSWPDPPGLVLVDRDMRTWIQATHPELEDRMFDNAGFAGVLRFSREAGELHMQYLDEYLTYREANS
ncbi:MAG: hypothetical protein HKN74_12375 [Acidimicrobiia bacterium]|nr:hypothetical protein [Acidimicrobiia bacterium]MBT8217786.1 hypothetical protein [Acidimicrobiia bacterium]NNF11072.1 hypothetical protein [Acidimicrobiia bacterium]NNL69929.1 hypothetical protein [Acidimicrobiia bacterium]